ncbi:MAG: type IV secretion system protein [Alphaproteobacteria bacterium]|nr:type IV secretion system protein [Alphaproteobacteria bacterium]
MGRIKQKNRQILLLWLFVANFCIAALTPFACMALGMETHYTGHKSENCDLGDMQSEDRNHRWWENPLSTVFRASVDVGNKTFDSVGEGAKGLMVVGGLLWVAIFLLKVEGGMQESDPMENLSKIGGLVFRMGIAGTLLSNRDFFFGYFLAPVIEAGAGFVKMEEISGGDEAPPPISIGSGGLSDATNALMEIAVGAHNSAANLQGAGRWVKCVGKIHELDLWLFSIWLPDPGLFFSGCLMQFAGWLLIAVFPFFLVDAGFRLGVVAALCPLFIVAWVFESTRSYASKGLQAVLNIAFVFMLIRIAIAIAMKLISGAAGIDTDDLVSMTPGVAGCRYKMLNFGGSDPCGSANNDSSTGNIFAIIIATVYALLMIRSASGELANYFASTDFKNDGAFKAVQGAGNVASATAHGAVMARQTMRTVGDTLKNSRVGKAIANSRVGQFVHNRKLRRQERRDNRRAALKSVTTDLAKKTRLNATKGIKDAKYDNRTVDQQQRDNDLNKALNPRLQGLQDKEKELKEQQKGLNPESPEYKDIQKKLDANQAEQKGCQLQSVTTKPDGTPMTTEERAEAAKANRQAVAQTWKDLKSEEKELKEEQKKYEPGTEKYNDIQKKLDANQTQQDAIKAWATSSDRFYEKHDQREDWNKDTYDAQMKKITQDKDVREHLISLNMASRRAGLNEFGRIFTGAPDPSQRTSLIDQVTGGGNDTPSTTQNSQPPQTTTPPGKPKKPGEDEEEKTE